MEWDLPYEGTHVHSLFDISQGVLCSVYCWLFLLGTANFLFPTLLVTDIQSLRNISCKVITGTLVFLLQTAWIPLNRFLHCVLSRMFYLPQSTSEILLPLCSLVAAILYFVDTLAYIQHVSILQTLQYRLRHQLAQWCRKCREMWGRGKQLTSATVNYFDRRLDGENC